MKRSTLLIAGASVVFIASIGYWAVYSSRETQAQWVSTLGAAGSANETAEARVQLDAWSTAIERFVLDQYVRELRVPRDLTETAFGQWYADAAGEEGRDTRAYSRYLRQASEALGDAAEAAKNLPINFEGEDPEYLYRSRCVRQEFDTWGEGALNVIVQGGYEQLPALQESLQEVVRQWDAMWQDVLGDMPGAVSRGDIAIGQIQRNLDALSMALEEAADALENEGPRGAAGVLDDIGLPQHPGMPFAELVPRISSMMEVPIEHYTRVRADYDAATALLREEIRPNVAALDAALERAHAMVTAESDSREIVLEARQARRYTMRGAVAASGIIVVLVLLAGWVSNRK